MPLTPEGYEVRQRIFELKLEHPDLTLRQLSQRLADEGILTSGGKPIGHAHLSRITNELKPKLDRARAERRLKASNVEGGQAEAAIKLGLLIDKLEEKMDSAEELAYKYRDDLSKLFEAQKIWTVYQKEYRLALKDLAKITGEGENNTQTHRFEGFDPNATAKKLRELDLE